MSASGGYAVGLFVAFDDLPLWQSIEAIELVVELQSAE